MALVTSRDHISLLLNENVKKINIMTKLHIQSYFDSLIDWLINVKREIF